MYRPAASDTPSPGATSIRTTADSDSSHESPTSGQYPAAAIWSSAATLAFHPTGSAGSSCGSLFNGSAGGGHHHYQSSCSASNAMAYLKSNPYAMAGITTPDLLHSGYPGEPLLFALLFATNVSIPQSAQATALHSQQLPGRRNYRKQGISVRGSTTGLKACTHRQPQTVAAPDNRSILSFNLISLFSRPNVFMNPSQPFYCSDTITDHYPKAISTSISRKEESGFRMLTECCCRCLVTASGANRRSCHRPADAFEG